MIFALSHSILASRAANQILQHANNTYVYNIILLKYIINL
jgi:hypothetical protein